MMPKDAATTRIDRIARLTGWGVCLLMVAVLARVAELQIAPSEQLRVYAENRVASRPVQGYRGEILDRRGRLLSTSRLGYRVFVDPERLDREKLDETITLLAEVIDQPVEVVGEKIVRAVSINDERRLALGTPPNPKEGMLQTIRAWLEGETDEREQSAAVISTASVSEVEAANLATEPGEKAVTEEKPKPLIRYVALGGILSETQVVAVRRLGLKGVHLERRPVREYPGGEIVASILGKVGFENRGLMGAELALNSSLNASNGTARYVRDASGRPLWIERGQWTSATHGSTQRLAIDLELQRIAREELDRGMEDADAAGGRLVMMDPETGEILAMVDLYRDVGELPEFPWVEKDPEPGSPPLSPPPPAYDP
ncbi:hypothetical protein MNBD_PLANCTO03-1771, partial [hydrothermal vent metagenome]